MRTLLILFTFLFSHTLFAQLNFEPLGSNPILEKAAAEKQSVLEKLYVKMVGPTTPIASVRDHDCDNIDGAFTSGETLYVISGEQIIINYNTEVYETEEDISVGLTHGTSIFDDTIGALVYTANTGVDLGLGDEIGVRLCPNSNPADCLEFHFPIVVKRADEQHTFPLETLTPDTVITICVDMLNLEGEIDASSVLPCEEPLLGSVWIGDKKDECYVYTASRFAEVDSVCFEICDEYCICDQYTYFFNVETTAAPFPFLDDFSRTGPYPDKTKWLDDNVFINTTMAKEPPTLGVATFDGLDKTGTPRNIGTARSDFLTSNYFTLDDSNTDLWVSFWLQNKGYGYPSNPGDSISLEFKNQNGDWIFQLAVDGENLLNSEFPDFEFYSIEIENTQLDTFLFDGFQFRFVNRGNTSSVQDTWHLDYVRLDEGEPNGSFNDVAFNQLPSTMLERYSSMPYWHFKDFAAMELNDTLLTGITNLFAEAKPTNPTNTVQQEEVSGTLLGGDFTVVEPAEIQIPGGGYLPVVRFVPQVTLDQLVTDFDANFSGSNYLAVKRTCSLTASNQYEAFENVVENDEVSSTTIFDNYFAYDDGSAEGAVSIPSVGPMVAVRFHANVADQLHGFSAHFPHYGGASTSDLFNIKVWVGTLDSDPVYEEDLFKPFFVDAVWDSLQGFTTYRFEDLQNVATPVDIPAGDFFIGWQTASPLNPVRIGWDRNTPDAKENQFYSQNGSQWVSTADEGAYMIRAVVGTESPGVTKAKEITSLEPQIKVFPNPVKEQLSFQLSEGDFADYDLSLYNMAGQTILQQRLTERLNVNQLVAGVYFIRLTDRISNMTQVERLIVQK